MTDIDISKIKPGDYVTVRARVSGVEDKMVPAGEICIVPDVHAHRFQIWIWVLPSAITGHEPAPEPLKVGDIVVICGDEYTLLNEKRCTILALFGERAWVKETEGPLDMLFHVSRLRRVEQP
jgi:hypothetical protein